MFKIGQIFNKNNAQLCLLDLLEYNYKKYALFEVTKEKIYYTFYEIIDTGSGYNLIEVKDENLNNNLLEIIDKKEEKVDEH